jgi:O-antigen/teichoic acid export membrane protein
MTIQPSATGGEVTRDSVPRDPASDAEKSGYAGSGVARKLIANTLFNFIGQAYVLVLSLGVVPYVVHRLGPGLYGVVALVQALAGFAGLLNLGMGRALTKWISELYWQGKLEQICSLFRTAATTCLLGGLVGLAILALPRTALASALFHGDADAEAVARFALWVAGLGLLLSLLTEPLSAIPIALQRFDIYNRMNIATATLRNLGAVLVLGLGYHVRAVLLVNLLSGLMALIGYAWFSRRLIPELRPIPGLSWADLKQLLGFSGFVLLAGVSGLVVHRLDRAVLAYFLPIAALAFYVVPYSLAEKTSLGVTNITSVIFPSASELWTRQDLGKLRELYLRAKKMVLLAGLPVTVILLAVPNEILRYWVGPEFALRGATTLRLLAAGYFVNILGHVPFVVAQGIGRPWISAKYSLLNGAANLLLFLLLIPRYGIAGAAMAFFLSQALVIPPFIWELNRVLGVSWRCVALRAYFRPLVCGAGALALLWMCRSYAGSLTKLVFLCGIALCAYALAAFAGAIDKRERAGMLDHFALLLRSQRRAEDV